MTRGGAASIDTGRFGTEAGMVGAGQDLGDQKPVPRQLRRVAGPVRVDFVLYAATDSNVISPALAKRMRTDMNQIINHPACTRAAVENRTSPGNVW